MRYENILAWMGQWAEIGANAMIPEVKSDQHSFSHSEPEVLIVEDSPPVARALAKLLSAHRMRPVICTNASDAIAQVEQFTPAAAVIDIHLPDLNGLVLSQQLRARFGAATPIVVVSGDGSPEILNSLSQVGATYFFSKPVSAKALVEKLQSLL